MTALKLEKTVALLALPPRRLVAQGLAPRRLLKGGEGGSLPLVLAGENSDKGKEELREAETGELMDENINNDDDSSSDGQEEEEEDDSDSSNDDINIGKHSRGDDTKGKVEGFEADCNSNDKAGHPIHAALVAGGINLLAHETRPLLRALGVSPRRLVKLGLVKREAVRAMPGRRGGGPGQYLRAGGPRKGGKGRPRGRPRVLGGPSSGCGPPRPTHGPPRHPFNGAGHHTMNMGEESEEGGISTSVGPHGSPGHRGPLHLEGRVLGPLRGPGHNSLPTVRHGRGPPGGGEHGHGHRHSPHGHGHGHRHYCGGLYGESEEEGGELLHGQARGPGQHGPRHHGGGGAGRSRGRPLGPPNEAVHGPFHGLFHEGDSGAPPGIMAHPHHGVMKLRGGRHGGGRGFCGGGGRGVRDGGGCGNLQHRRMAHLTHFGGRHQPQLEAY